MSRRGVEVLPITFLSDYGYEDEYVGVCHGVIARIAPQATVIDLAHGLPAGRVGPAARALRNALPYLPLGVHLAVVDPGVGTSRRPLALRCADGRYLVGPDNGLLWPALEACGGASLAVDINESPHRLQPVSATFHGRDLFAPVAAALALGAPLEEAGEPVAPDTLVPLDSLQQTVLTGCVRASVASIDRFGNVILSLGSQEMGAAGFSHGDTLRVSAGDARTRALYTTTFADVGPGETLVYEDSSGSIAVAVNSGRAADALGISHDDELELAEWPTGR